MKTRKRIKWKNWAMNEDFYIDYQGVDILTINKYGENPLNKELPEFPINALWNVVSVKSQDRFIDEEMITERATVRGGRRCAICGKQIRKSDLCYQHYKEHGPRENYPNWVVELIRIESHTQRSVEPREVVNSALSNDKFDFLLDNERIPFRIENEFDGVIPGATRKLKRYKPAF